MHWKQSQRNCSDHIAQSKGPYKWAGSGRWRWVEQPPEVAQNKVGPIGAVASLFKGKGLPLPCGSAASPQQNTVVPDSAQFTIVLTTTFLLEKYGE